MMELNGKILDEKKGQMSSRTQSLGDEKTGASNNKSKAAEIVEACKWRDIQKLKELAMSEAGFLSDELRSEACQSSCS